MQTGTCSHLEMCPVDCELRDWTGWTYEKKYCSVETCPVDCEWNIEADYGGTLCTGESKASRGCFLKPCPIHCQWTDWSTWTDCSSSCGTGQQSRSRSIAVQPQFEGNVCEGFAADTRSCDDLPPCPIDCEWDEWADWGACSNSCGTGVSRRTRERKKYEKDGGHICWGTEDDEQVCTLNPCPVDCTMGAAQWIASGFPGANGLRAPAVVEVAPGPKDRNISEAAASAPMTAVGSLAKLGGIKSSTVKVDLTIPQAILLSMWRRRATGNVNVAYLIEVLESSEDAESIAQKISKQDIDTVTAEVRSQLELNGLNFTVRATSLSVTILWPPELQLCHGSNGGATRVYQHRVRVIHS
eukprot:Skav225518  [mRNA]  locus=scaffold2974:17062:31992:- [translate_table: standard]